MTTAWAPRSRRPDKEAAARDAAEALAISALGWLAQDGETLERFLSLSGLTPHTLREAAAAPGFLGAVLAHLMNDESLLMAFAANETRAPEDIARAARLLDPARDAS